MYSLCVYAMLYMALVWVSFKSIMHIYFLLVCTLCNYAVQVYTYIIIIYRRLWNLCNINVCCKPYMECSSEIHHLFGRISS